MTTLHDETKELRRFGLAVGGIFSAIALWPTLIHGQNPKVVALVLGVALVVPALLWPRALRPAHRIWIALGNVLNWINTRIILTIIFYGLVTPLGLIMRLWGRDPMCRRFETVGTYRVLRRSRPATHMMRQF